jgi:hypothetical protein
MYQKQLNISPVLASLVGYPLEMYFLNQAEAAYHRGITAGILETNNASLHNGQNGRGRGRHSN